MKMKERVLIIDDYPAIRNTVKRVLGESGYEVLTAKNGEEGLAMTQTHDPDLILLDIRLPGIDGYEVLKALVEDPFTNHIPVIMLTNLSDTRRICRGLDAGADDYVTKPFEFRELCARVQRLIERSHDFVYTGARRL